MVLQLAFNPAGDYLYGLNGLELVRIRLADLRVQKQPLPAGFEAGELNFLDDQSAVVSEVSVRLAGRSGSMQVVQLDHLFDEQQRKLSWFWRGKGSVAAVTPNPAQPDSFAFALLQDQGWQIWLREAGQDKQLTELQSSVDPINHISWSPDGKQLVFSHKKILWLYQLEQQKLTQLLPQAEFLFPVFDPSGDSLVVQRDLNKQQQIWRVQLPSGQLQRLGLNQGSVPQFDQGQLYYYRGNQLMQYVDGGKGDQVLSRDAGSLLSSYRLSQGWVYYYLHDKSEFRRFPLHQPDAVEKVTLQQLQLQGKGMPMTFTMQPSAPQQLFVNMMMYPQLHLYLLRWPAFAD
jgi:WD40 repeat protein